MFSALTAPVHLAVAPASHRASFGAHCSPTTGGASGLSAVRRPCCRAPEAARRRAASWPAESIGNAVRYLWRRRTVGAVRLQPHRMGGGISYPIGILAPQINSSIALGGPSCRQSCSMRRLDGTITFHGQALTNIENGPTAASINQFINTRSTGYAASCRRCHQSTRRDSRLC